MLQTTFDKMATADAAKQLAKHNNTKFKLTCFSENDHATHVVYIYIEDGSIKYIFFGFESTCYLGKHTDFSDCDTYCKEHPISYKGPSEYDKDDIETIFSFLVIGNTYTIYYKDNNDNSYIPIELTNKFTIKKSIDCETSEYWTYNGP